MPLWIGISFLIPAIWLFGLVYFYDKPQELSGRDKAIAWLLFGGPSILSLFHRKLTKWELIGWGIFLLVVVTGIAFQELTCLGLGRDESCS